MHDRARLLLDKEIYRFAKPNPINITGIPIPICSNPNQYILRMMLKRPGTNILIPEELKWIEPALHAIVKYNNDRFVNHPYLYITIRHGIVQSITDDEWHVDGFSMKTRHLPEIQYIYSDQYPTELLNQMIAIPYDFNPMKHNIHSFFQDSANERNVKSFNPGWNVIDPYVIHRRPSLCFGKQRTMVRISFLPVEIEDNSNTPNPLLPCSFYMNEDIRKKLIRYTE